jgi:hypothetical protein
MDPSLRFGRAASWFGALLCTALGAAAPGCGTDPVNPDGCKAIEDARCEAVVACPGYESLDVDACKRAYRDQCLHGLAVESDPGDPSINQCVNAIKAAGDCAKAGTASCALAADRCTFIEHPEQLVECAFLAPPSTPDAGTDAAEEPADNTSDDAASAEAPSDDGG